MSEYCKLCQFREWQVDRAEAELTGAARRLAYRETAKNAADLLACRQTLKEARETRHQHLVDFHEDKR